MVINEEARRSGLFDDLVLLSNRLQGVHDKEVAEKSHVLASESAKKRPKC